MTALSLTVMALAIGLTAIPASADDGSWDRLENRADAAESQRDRENDRSVRDQVEDRLDRLEGRLDQADIPDGKWVDRTERRKWKRIAVPG